LNLRLRIPHKFYNRESEHSELGMLYDQQKTNKINQNLPCMVKVKVACPFFPPGHITFLTLVHLFAAAVTSICSKCYLSSRGFCLIGFKDLTIIRHHDLSKGLLMR